MTYTVYERVRAGHESWSYIKRGRALRSVEAAKRKVDAFGYGGIVCPFGSNQPIYGKD